MRRAGRVRLRPRHVENYHADRKELARPKRSTTPRTVVPAFVASASGAMSAEPPERRLELLDRPPSARRTDRNPFCAPPPICAAASANSRETDVRTASGSKRVTEPSRNRHRAAAARAQRGTAVVERDVRFPLLEEDAVATKITRRSSSPPAAARGLPRSARSLVTSDHARARRASSNAPSRSRASSLAVRGRNQAIALVQICATRRGRARAGGKAGEIRGASVAASTTTAAR